jgi:hypothetical protein
MPLQGTSEYWAGEVQAQGQRYRIRELDEGEYAQWEQLGRQLQVLSLDAAEMAAPVQGETRTQLDERLNKARDKQLEVTRLAREQLNFIVSRCLVWWDEKEDLTPENAVRLPAGVKVLIASRASRETLLTQTEEDFLLLQPGALNPEIPSHSQTLPNPQ